MIIINKTQYICWLVENYKYYQYYALWSRFYIFIYCTNSDLVGVDLSITVLW